MPPQKKSGLISRCTGATPVHRVRRNEAEPLLQVQGIPVLGLGVGSLLVPTAGQSGFGFSAFEGRYRDSNLDKGLEVLGVHRAV